MFPFAFKGVKKLKILVQEIKRLYLTAGMLKPKKEAPATPGETRRNQRSGDHQPNQGGETIISDDLDLEHC